MFCLTVLRLYYETTESEVKTPVLQHQSDVNLTRAGPLLET